MSAKELAEKTAELCVREFKRPHRRLGKGVVSRLKLRVASGKATTGPPLSPIFGAAGLKAMDFIKPFNDRSAPIFKPGVELRVKVWSYPDRTFDTFILPPNTTWFLKKACGIEKFTGNHNEIQGVITPQMCYHIAEFVRPITDDRSLARWTAIIAGVARSMAIQVVDKDTEVKVEKVEIRHQVTDADDWIFR
mmetsp:Transcript_17872/g.31706  ORF Transcript_17872/g.31706 Transcript_17872/m.31706 type:complete len:192 (-) Transcript_17872:885-1460(-)